MISAADSTIKSKLVELYISAQTDDYLFFVTPYFQKDLSQIDASVFRDTFKLKYMFAKVVLILRALRSMKVVHRDIKVINLSF